MSDSRRVLVTDFDGTVTDQEFYQLLSRQYLPPGAPDYWALYARGELTHFEAMKSFFEHAPTDPDSLEALLDQMEPAVDLRESIEDLHARGWEVAIASAGSSWYIQRLLARAGLDGVTVHASPGTIEPGRGLVMRLPEDSSFLSREAGIDKEAIVRAALDRADVVAYAGDGPLDLGSALLVKPEYRFARRWLAAELQRRGQPFRLFRVWSDIAAAVSDA